jgi:hypothetical protein
MHGKVTLLMGNGPWHLVSALATQEPDASHSVVGSATDQGLAMSAPRHAGASVFLVEDEVMNPNDGRRYARRAGLSHRGRSG